MDNNACFFLKYNCKGGLEKDETSPFGDRYPERVFQR
jgi:hypothetical protein